jgi:anti-sigma factor RsiW
MNCAQCQAEFDRLLDGPAADPASAPARQHLAACPDCAAAWRDYESAWKAFLSAPEVDPSSTFTARVMSRIDREERKQAERPWFPLIPWRWLAPATAAITLLVATTGVWTTYQWDADQAVSQELAVNLPVVQHLELLSDFDVISNLDRISPQLDHDPIEEMLNALWNS